MSIIVAIDGPAAAGKGTLAQMVASEYNIPYLDTGSLYRASAARAIDLKIDPIEAARTLEENDLHRENLREANISQEASRISAIPEVRAALKDYQVRFSTQPGGAVLDGRDIGSSIAPQAEAKIFLTASTEARAARRHRQYLEQDAACNYEDVLSEMRIRDERDSSRAASPMKPGPQSHILDTTDLTLQEAVDRVFEIIDPIIISTRNAA